MCVAGRGHWTEQTSSRDVGSRDPPTHQRSCLPVTFLRNVLLGLVLAAVLAVSASGAALYGVAIWKIALAAAGALVFVVAGRK